MSDLKPLARLERSPLYANGKDQDHKKDLKNALTGWGPGEKEVNREISLWSSIEDGFRRGPEESQDNEVKALAVKLRRRTPQQAAGYSFKNQLRI
jgi:hypothetical protein